MTIVKDTEALTATVVAEAQQRQEPDWLIERRPRPCKNRLTRVFCGSNGLTTGTGTCLRPPR